jgi:hypothetical protein
MEDDRVIIPVEKGGKKIEEKRTSKEQLAATPTL